MRISGLVIADSSMVMTVVVVDVSGDKIWNVYHIWKEKSLSTTYVEFEFAPSRL